MVSPTVSIIILHISQPRFFLDGYGVAGHKMSLTIESHWRGSLPDCLPGVGPDGPNLAVLQEPSVGLWQAVHPRLDQAVQFRGVKSLSGDIFRDPRGSCLEGDGVGAAGLLQFEC